MLDQATKDALKYGTPERDPDLHLPVSTQLEQNNQQRGMPMQPQARRNWEPPNVMPGEPVYHFIGSPDKPGTLAIVMGYGLGSSLKIKDFTDGRLTQYDGVKHRDDPNRGAEDDNGYWTRTPFGEALHWLMEHKDDLQVAIDQRPVIEERIEELVRNTKKVAKKAKEVPAEVS